MMATQACTGMQLSSSLRFDDCSNYCMPEPHATLSHGQTFKQCYCLYMAVIATDALYLECPN